MELGEQHPPDVTRFLNAALLLICVLFVQAGGAEEGGDTRADSLVSISLADGSLVEGTVIEETETYVLIETPAGLEARVPRTSIVAIRKRHPDAFSRPDPNYTRLMFAPTGRPLRGGDGYFFDHWVFFPGIAYGFNDRVGVAAGLSVFPGVGLDEQILSLAPKVALYDSGDSALSAGVLYMRALGVADVTAGMAFVAGTRGSRDRSFTCGLGLGYIAEEDEGVEFAEHPVLLLGGNVRLSETTALVSENWIITGQGLGPGEQPLGLALRFFGSRIAVDAGAIVILEAGGFPLPWLSFVYNFGG